MPMETQSSHKKFEIQRYPSEISRYSLLWARFLKRKVPKFWKSPTKTFLGPMLGQDRLEKNSGGCLVRRGEIPSPRQTSIDQSNDCVINSERSALVRSSDPPWGHRVHTMAGDMWRALARLMMKKQLAAGVYKTDDQFSRSVSNGKNSFFQVWEDTVARRRQAIASQTMDPPDIFQVVICTRWPCPSPSGLAVG